MGKLTARRAATAGPGKHEDGEGLRLVVSKTGARKWVFRVTVKGTGKRREMGLGAYPEVALGDARKKAAAARSLALEGVDPIEAKHRVETTAPTFVQAAARHIRAHRRGWSNSKHARQWVSTLKTYARPVIGSKPVDTISTEDVLSILTPIWTAKTETAKRVQGRIENVLDYATAMKWCDPVNPARWRGHLDKLLPKPASVKKVRHHPAMPYNELPAFMAELRANGSTSALALEWLILTATRTQETLGARWDELDLETAIWTVPAVRMKGKPEYRRDHRVPLTESMLAVLARLPRIEGNHYLFPGTRRGRPINDMALLYLMCGMGYGVDCERGDYVPHGFRSSFRDWSGEVSSFPRDVCEMALAHTIRDRVEAAYRRGDLFEKRRKLMEAWCAWCLPKTTNKVVSIQPHIASDADAFNRAIEMLRADR